MFALLIEVVFFYVNCTCIVDLLHTHPELVLDKKVLLTNSAQPPAVTLGRAVATREADQFVSLLKVSRLLGDSRSSDETHYQKDTRPWHDIGEGGG